jgi:hypothetical protein
MRLQQLLAALSAQLNGPLQSLPEDMEFPLRDVASLIERDLKLHDSQSLQKCLVSFSVKIKIIGKDSRHPADDS